MTQEPRSYTTVDVAERLGASLQTVQRRVDAGHLEAWKPLGGHRRIEAAGAELLFKEREAGVGARENAPTDLTSTTAVSVVVVDDDPMDLALLVMMVHKAFRDAHVEAAANGFQGLVAVGKASPQIVATDIHMPHMNGFEMVRSLLDDAALRPRTLIAVSAFSMQDLAEMGTLPPGVQVFTKPLDQNRFVAALRSTP